MKTKIIPFDLEMAKKIQEGEIKGRIVTNNGYGVRIICFDKRTSSGYPILGLVDYPNQSEMCKAFNVHGLCYDQLVECVLQIELPKETSKHVFKPFDRVLVRDADYQEWHISLYESCGNGGFYVLHGDYYNQCILYAGHEHLVGTTNKPKEE